MSRLFLLTLLLSACTHHNGLPVKNKQFENQTGEIQVFVCGRGCAQHLLKTDGVLYAPVNLPAEFKLDGADVLFSGELLADSTQINRFGPDDRLIPDFKVRNLTIKQIVRK
ncbi:MAG: hypothetical protein ABIQ93_14930 [Saprospiraceae bacterium]